MTSDEIEALCSLADQYALADDPPYATAFGDLAAALRALAQENEVLRARKERLRLFVLAVRDNANLCSPICPACETNEAFAIEVLHGAVLGAARAGENTP